MFGIGDKITITFIVFAELQSAGDTITVIFIVFAELGTVPQITILADYGFGRLVLPHESFSNL